MVILAFLSFAQAREEARVMSRAVAFDSSFPAQAADWRAPKYAMFSLATLSMS
jgi:hypothetical protein